MGRKRKAFMLVSPFSNSSIFFGELRRENPTKFYPLSNFRPLSLIRKAGSTARKQYRRNIITHVGKVVFLLSTPLYLAGLEIS